MLFLIAIIYNFLLCLLFYSISSLMFVTGKISKSSPNFFFSLFKSNITFIHFRLFIFFSFFSFFFVCLCSTMLNSLGFRSKNVSYLIHIFQNYTHIFCGMDLLAITMDFSYYAKMLYLYMVHYILNCLNLIRIYYVFVPIYIKQQQQRKASTPNQLLI